MSEQHFRHQVQGFFQSSAGQWLLQDMKQIKIIRPQEKVLVGQTVGKHLDVMFQDYLMRLREDGASLWLQYFLERYVSC